MQCVSYCSIVIYDRNDKFIFPSENTFDGWRLVSSDNIVRRLIGDDEIQVAGVLDLATGSNRITDIKIGLNTNLTGLTNYYTKAEVDNSLALKAPFASPALTGTISIAGDITCSNATATAIAANKSLTLQRTGDVSVGTVLQLQNREGVRGISVQTSNAELLLTDIVM